MNDTLEFNEIYQEVKGTWNDGRLRFSKQTVVYKNSKTGKVDSIPVPELTQAQWRRVCLGHGIKLCTSTGNIYKYDGFKDTDLEKISEYFKANYKVDLIEKDMCVKGWNWGTAKFNGPLLSFEVNESSAFEIPLASVSQCATGKNEVTMEFHQNDDTEVSLMEVRFYVPPTTGDEGSDPVEAFAQNILSKADVIQATGDAVCIFRELQCLTPRGRYDIRIYPTFLHLHGKTFDYKIPYTTVLRLFLLPHKDQRQMFFVISLDPPIKQGQTRYHFLILLFSKEEEISLTLNMNEDEVERRFEGKLHKNMSGSLYEMVSRVMKALVNRKITVPGNFQGHSGAQCITCSYKASSGLLYPLERGFIYVHKPPVHLRFEEISCVNFARGTTTTRSFDFEIETKQGNQYTFSSIEREEYGKLFDFVNAKKLSIKNRGFKEGMKRNDNMYSDSDDDQHDAYLERMKEEGKIREEANDSDDSEGESGEWQLSECSLVHCHFGFCDHAYSMLLLDGIRFFYSVCFYTLKFNATFCVLVCRKRQRTAAPPRAETALNQRTRASLSQKSPKRLGKCGNNLVWDAKAEEAKKEYDRAMREYKESGGGSSGSSKKKKKGGKNEEKKKRKSGGGREKEKERATGNDSFKSREFISSEESSSESDKGKGRKRKVTH
uniref:FACT complex subunit SSRP1 n=1 Tax=Sinocyclocheilus grahami TaxID=75366 RepID=A0A672QFT7_SINGR